MILTRLSTEAMRTSVAEANVSSRLRHAKEDYQFHRVTLMTKVINNHRGHLESCVIIRVSYQVLNKGMLNTWIRSLTFVNHERSNSFSNLRFIHSRKLTSLEKLLESQDPQNFYQGGKKCIGHEEFVNNIFGELLRPIAILSAALSVSVDLMNPKEVERLRQVLRLWTHKMLELEIIFKDNNAPREENESWHKKSCEENNQRFKSNVSNRS